MSDRQKQILHWINEGKTNWEIAHILGMTEKNVKYHIEQIFAKLGVRTRAQAAAKAMLMGHIQVSLANSLRGDNPFSDACLIAMDYGRDKIIKDDWKSIFNDDELDHVLKQMLHLDHINR